MLDIINELWPVASMVLAIIVIGGATGRIAEHFGWDGWIFR